MKNITLDELHTLAAAAANAEQGSKAWDKATDALNAKFSPQCLVNLIEQIESLKKIELAAQKLVKCKGRYHAELNYRALAELFGVKTHEVTTQDVTAVDGWKLVPIEPTEQMMLNESGCQRHPWNDEECVARQTRRFIWKHMVEAAPAMGGGDA